MRQFGDAHRLVLKRVNVTMLLLFGHCVTRMQARPRTLIHELSSGRSRRLLQVASVACKHGSIAKEDLGLKDEEKIRSGH